MWRLFCCNRLMPWSRTRPVIKKDLAIVVVKPSMRTPATNPTKTNFEFL